MENLSLIYVSPIGENSEGLYEYEFFFSESSETTWGEDWAEQCPSVCGNILPDDEYINKKMRLTTDVPFYCAQNNSCFSMQDCIDHIIALAFEDISEYEDYPEPYRIVFQFGDSLETVNEKLNGREIFFDED